MASELDVGEKRGMGNKKRQQSYMEPCRCGRALLLQGEMWIFQV